MSTIVYCENDEENEAIVYCKECEQYLCDDCDDVFHRSKKRQTHRRIPIDKAIITNEDNESEEETEEKKKQLKVAFSYSKKESVILTFGATLQECMASQKDEFPELEVPIIVTRLIEALVEKGGLQEEGIFRISPSSDRVEEVKKLLLQGTLPSIDCDSAHVPAALLKMWVRQLPQPLISAKLYSLAIACAQKYMNSKKTTTSDLEEGAMIAALSVWAECDILAQRVLSHIAALMQNIVKPENSATNKMTMENLAIIFAPNIMKGPEKDKLINFQHEINFCKLLFEVLPTAHIADKLRTKNSVVQIPTFSLDPLPKKESIEGKVALKILVVGNAACGKTSLVSRYAKDEFDDAYNTTVGADYCTKTIDWAESTTVFLQLWDIAGQDRYIHMTRPFYQGADGAIIVCDVIRSESINKVRAWKNDINSNLDDLPCVMVANKCDLLKDGATGMKIGAKLQTISDEMNFVGWYITSAKKNMQVTEAIHALVKSILKRRACQEVLGKRNISPVLTKENGSTRRIKKVSSRNRHKKNVDRSSRYGDRDRSESQNSRSQSKSKEKSTSRTRSFQSSKEWQDGYEESGHDSDSADSLAPSDKEKCCIS